MDRIFVFPLLVAAFALLVYAMMGKPLIKIEKHYHYDKMTKRRKVEIFLIVVGTLILAGMYTLGLSRTHANKKEEVRILNQKEYNEHILYPEMFKNDSIVIGVVKRVKK